MAKYSFSELHEVLDALESKYNCADFIENDPISIPHSFSEREDIEIAGFLVSLIAWGNRRMILRSAHSMIERMDNSPAQFIKNATNQEIAQATSGFVHRTFNDTDFEAILLSLKELIKEYGSLGNFFEQSFLESGDIRVTIADFRRKFFADRLLDRSLRHISSIEKGSACKRLCMYLRWMVRRDNRGVDFGLWQQIPASALYIPLDVHSAREGREFGLLKRKSNDWLAVEELTCALRTFDAQDPVRYDFALFGLGVDPKSP